MEWLRKYLFTCLLAISIFACGRQTNPVLDEIESYIQEKPDSAYAALKSFDRSTLRSEEDKAHFALLYSISLDKMYIDLTEDTLITVAVNYYGREKSRNAFMSWYYQGRVYENANRYEDALSSYIKAESVPEKKVEPLYLGKLHFGKSRVYSYSFRKKESFEEIVAAADYSLKAGNVNNYARAVLDQALMYCSGSALGYQDFAKADSCLNIVQSLWSQLSFQRQYNWYDGRITYYTTKGETEQLRALIDEYLDFMALVPEKIEWIMLASAYRELGDTDRMKEALDNFTYYGQNIDDELVATYLLLLSEANASLENIQEAYNTEKAFRRKMMDRYYYVTRHDTQFLEERHNYEIVNTEQHYKILALILISMISILIILYLVATLRDHKRESEISRKQMAELREEYDTLQSLQVKNDEIGTKALSILEDRMMTLKGFLEKDEKAAVELDRLSGDRTAVLESIGMIYAIYAPKFTEALFSKGLTPSEIGYCCLHLMGYNTKEAGQFICYSGYYNVSSRIRAKIQIDSNASTLAKWLKQLYAEKQTS